MLIQAHLAPCITFTYSQPCHVLSPGIFRTGSLFNKTQWNFDQAYSEPYHKGLVLFRHIQNLVQCLHIQKPDMLRTYP